MDEPDGLPTLFLAHGAPTLALDGGAWGDRLTALGKGLPAVKAVIVCSAHWETSGGFRVGGQASPRTIHDFGGFPDPLYHLKYPAPGDPDLAHRVARRLTEAGFDAVVDAGRGLDHGVWVPLRYLAAEADVPVLPLSLPRPRGARQLYEAGRALAPLRREGVLIVGSGGLVHNLGRLDGSEGGVPEPWALAFEAWILDRLHHQPERALAWEAAPGAELAVPTSEHLDPLWLALGAGEGQPVTSLYEGWQWGSLSLRCLGFGLSHGSVRNS
ncbi:MAG TPA: class III extradiol ring-cleavage dioxygenase [Holophagaceae bacterium]